MLSEFEKEAIRVAKKHAEEVTALLKRRDVSMEAFDELYLIPVGDAIEELRNCDNCPKRDTCGMMKDEPVKKPMLN